MARTQVTNYSVGTDERSITLTGLASVDKTKIVSIREAGTGKTLYLAEDAPRATLVGKTLTLPKGVRIGTRALVIYYDADFVAVPPVPGTGTTVDSIADVPGLQDALSGKADTTAIMTALTLKAPLASPAFTGTPTGITKAHVGLANVDNTSDATNLAAAATARDVALRVATSPRLGPVSTKYTYGCTGLSDGTLQGQTSRSWADIGADVTGVRLVYANFYLGDLANPNSIFVKAGVEVTPAGTPTDTGTTVTPVYFDGQRTATIAPGGLLVSDIIPVTLKKGQGCYTRTYVSVATLGQKWPLGKFNDAGSVAGGATLDRVTSTNVDSVDAADPTTIGNTWLRVYTPIAIIAVTATRTIWLSGDSIFAGQATNSSQGDERGGGWGHRAFKGAAGVINTSLPSERIETYFTSSLQYRTQLARYCTDVLAELGNGDVHVGTNNFATVAARMQKYFQFYASMGLRVHSATIVPRTTSTDNWVTTTNQTASSQNSVRVAVNDWLRAGAPQDVNGVAVAPGTAGAVVNPVLVTVSDVADAVETSRNSGIFKANYTADGVHPNAVGHAAMAATVPVAQILTTGPVVGSGVPPLPQNNPLYSSAVTAFARTLLDDADAATARATLAVADRIAAPEPSDQGLIAWAYDPIHATATSLPTAGTVNLIRVPIRYATTITNVILYVATAGANLQNCFAGLYQNGVLLASTADQSAAWVSTGNKIMALTTPQAVTAGFVEIGFVANVSTGTVTPAFGRLSSFAGNTLGQTNASSRWGAANSGQSTLPNPYSGRTAQALAYFGAVS